MGAFADLFRPSPNRRHSASPSLKQPHSLSTLDVPLPLPQPMWALATEPEYGRRPGPRDMRTAEPGGTGSMHGRTLKMMDRRGNTTEIGFPAGHDGRGDVIHATGDFGMAGLSVSDSPGPSTYPPQPPYPPSASYTTPPRLVPPSHSTNTPHMYPPPPPQPTASPSHAPLIPLNVAVNSHRSGLPYYTPPNHSPARSTPQSARVSPERPLPPTPPPCPPRLPSHHSTPPHPVPDSRLVYRPTSSSSRSSPTRVSGQPAPVVPPRPPPYPEQRYQQPSPTRLADRTNAATPQHAFYKSSQGTPHRASSPTKGKGKAKQPVVLDIDSSSDDSFIDDSAVHDDDGGENDSLLEELRESVFRGKKSSGKDPIKAVAARRTPISTPSPRRRRKSSTPTRSGQPQQCSGITSAGRRCTRSCSPSLGTSGEVGDEGAEVGFCKQHAKTALKESGCFVAGRAGGEQWVRFSDWISESLPVETQALLRHYMAKPVSEKDEDGYIYIHELLASPHSATLPTAHLKLGRSIHPLLRLSQHRRTNTLCPLLGEPIVRYIFPSPSAPGGGVKLAEKGGRNSHRWERLCLVELAGRAVML
ncbi:T5orf172 domain-containing protein [Rhodotorula toruloides]|nr:T5orf172 domain-containing protein [Rhodotorula toruloides]